MAFLPLVKPLIHELREILVVACHALGDLHDDPSLQLELFPFVEVVIVPPVHVTDVVPALVVDHNTLVVRVVLEASILPSFLFPLEVVGKEARVLEDRCGVVRTLNGASGGAKGSYGYGHPALVFGGRGIAVKRCHKVL